MNSEINNAADEKQRDSDVAVFTDTAPVRETRNIHLAALMVTLGFEMKETSGQIFTGDGISAPGGTVTWSFSQQSEDGRFSSEEVMRLWDDQTWLTQSGNESPLAYVACAFHNYIRLVDRIKTKVPLAVVKKGKRRALVRLDADANWQGMACQFLDGRLAL